MLLVMMIKSINSYLAFSFFFLKELRHRDFADFSSKLF